MDVIDSFRDDYFFLSNMFYAPFTVNGIEFISVENAFQSFKTLDIIDRNSFAKIKPSEARKIGKKLKLRNDWENIKDEIMFRLVFLKFKKRKDLRVKLIQTYPAELRECNNHGDDYWGVCNGKGQNKLGEILMKVREIMMSPEYARQEGYIFK